MSEILENLSNAVQVVYWPVIIWHLLKLNEKRDD